MNYQCVIINKDLTENVDERIILENEKMVQNTRYHYLPGTI